MNLKMPRSGHLNYSLPLGGKVARPQAVTDEGACGHSAASASDTPRGTSGLWSQCPWGMADEACPPQGSGPIFTARRVWKSVCRNESTSFPGKIPVIAPSFPPVCALGYLPPEGEGEPVKKRHSRFLTG